MLFDTYLPPAVFHLNHEAANYFLAKGKEGKRPLVTTYQAALIQPAALFQGAAQRLSASCQPGIQVPTYLQSITSIFLASKA
jgi:hypothetical protein